MRKLKANELYDGIYVQTGRWDEDYFNQIYQIIINDDGMFYTVPGGNWKQSGELVKDNWIETPETLRLNRENKINVIISMTD